MNLVDELHAIVQALAEASLPYAVCGGIAVTITVVSRDVLLKMKRLAARAQDLADLEKLAGDDT